MIQREVYLQKISKGFEHNPIVVLLGARQVGKTTLMEMFAGNKKHIWLYGQDPETISLFIKLSTIEQYLTINSNKNLDILLVIDEFQYINNISTMLKLLVDKYKKIKILCSGSSSLEITQKIEESLAGRVRTLNVFPLSFTEYVKFKNEELHSKLLKCNYGDNINILFPKIQQYLFEYMTYGGLPKVALCNDLSEKTELLNDIYKTYLLRDVKQFIKNENILAFNNLLQILSAQIGNLVNVNELSQRLQIPYKTCEGFLYILEQMFVIRLIKPYSTNKRKEITKMKKVFFFDTGLRNMIYNSFNDIMVRVDNGQIFENFVFIQLQYSQRLKNIFFYRTSTGTEIDFIIKSQNNILVPFEVKFKRFDKPRKIRALTQFLSANKLEKSFVVNLNRTDTHEQQIFVQPYLIDKLKL